MYYHYETESPSLLFVEGKGEDRQVMEFPYSIHRVAMTGLAFTNVDNQHLLKRMTLARLLADAMCLHRAELLIEVRQG
jgi:hypothetical protein